MSLLLTLCLAGALLELDTTYAFQLTLSRGIVAGPLLGLLIHDPLVGLQIGIFTELLFIDISPLGGMLPPSAVVCCTISLALYSLAIPVYFAFFFGVLGAILFAACEIYMRKQRSGWLARQEPKIFKTPGYVNWVILQTLFLSFSVNFIFMSAFSAAWAFALVGLLPFVPDQIHLAGKFAYISVPWIGLATLVGTFRLKTR